METGQCWVLERYFTYQQLAIPVRNILHLVKWAHHNPATCMVFRVLWPQETSEHTISEVKVWISEEYLAYDPLHSVPRRNNGRASILKRLGDASLFSPVDTAAVSASALATCLFHPSNQHDLDTNKPYPAYYFILCL